MRYFIEIAYNGGAYFGWQKQPHQITVQEVLEESMSTILREDIKLVGAGRTDTGVHAEQLYAHFDSDGLSHISKLIFRINSFLPRDIAIKNILEVTDDAHARFDAVQREYQYKIAFGKDPFSQEFAFQLYRNPNVELMNKGAEMLFAYTDFQCFSRSKSDVKTFNCKIEKAEWKWENGFLVFTIIADRFLRNMVRAIVGTLLDIGFNKTTLLQFRDILESKNRGQAGASAPAHGLFLKKVVYPEHIFIKSKERFL